MCVYFLYTKFSTGRLFPVFYSQWLSSGNCDFFCLSFVCNAIIFTDNKRDLKIDLSVNLFCFVWFGVSGMGWLMAQEDGHLREFVTLYLVFGEETMKYTLSNHLLFYLQVRSSWTKYILRVYFYRGGLFLHLVCIFIRNIYCIRIWLVFYYMSCNYLINLGQTPSN